MKKTFTINKKRSLWLQLVQPRNAFEAYCKIPGGRIKDKSNFCNFIRNPKAEKGEDWSIERDYDEAMRVFKAFGVTAQEVETADSIPLEDVDDDESTKKNEIVEDEFFGNCGELLWNNRIVTPSCCIKVVNEDICSCMMDILDLVVARKNAFTPVQKRYLLRELSDFLLESRNFERWNRWAGGVAKVYQREFERNKDWFPNFSKAGREQYEDRAFALRCFGLQINALRHRSFALWLEGERLKTRKGRIEEIHERETLDEKLSEIQAKRSAFRVEIRLMFRRAYVPSGRADAGENLVKPVIDSVVEKKDPAGSYFVLVCARFFLDWAKWHFASQMDVARARDMLETVGIWCEQRISMHSKQCDSESEYLTFRFRYILSNVYRLLATELLGHGVWVSCDYDVDEYDRRRVTDSHILQSKVKEARELVGKAVRVAHEAVDSVEDGRSASSYRARRNYARICTFAARWCVKHACYGMNIENMAYSWLQDADRECAFTLRLPLGSSCSSDGQDGIVLSAKRKLEYEFHLRTQIELLVTEFEHEYASGETYRGELDAEKVSHIISAFCEMLLIYLYLFPSSSIGSEVKDGAAQWLAHNKVDRPLSRRFDVMALAQTRQFEPPSLNCQLETLCALQWNFRFRDKERRETAIWSALARLPHAGDDFARRILDPAISGLLRDYDQVLKAVKKKDDLKGFVFELVNTPGSMGDEVRRIVSYCFGKPVMKAR